MHIRLIIIKAIFFSTFYIALYGKDYDIKQLDTSEVEENKHFVYKKNVLALEGDLISMGLFYYRRISNKFYIGGGIGVGYSAYYDSNTLPHSLIFGEIGGILYADIIRITYNLYTKNSIKLYLHNGIHLSYLWFGESSGRFIGIRLIPMIQWRQIKLGTALAFGINRYYSNPNVGGPPLDTPLPKGWKNEFLILGNYILCGINYDF
ncbi:hypothetical protein JYT51_01130 [Candidatus Amoebophilus asiaticus]|nr:hypothetical protein [Candidatus Amoebophilus asiaticus]